MVGLELIIRIHKPVARTECAFVIVCNIEERGLDVRFLKPYQYY